MKSRKKFSFKTAISTYMRSLCNKTACPPSYLEYTLIMLCTFILLNLPMSHLQPCTTLPFFLKSDSNKFSTFIVMQF
jgi:hypothetical protein